MAQIYNMKDGWLALSAAKFEHLLKEAVMQADRETLEAALLGYGQQLATVNAKIEAIRQQLRGPAMAKPGRWRGRATSNDDLAGGAPWTATQQLAAAKPAKRHQISAEGRARIAAAQRKRWALSKKAKAAA